MHTFKADEFDHEAKRKVVYFFYAFPYRLDREMFLKSIGITQADIEQFDEDIDYEFTRSPLSLDLPQGVFQGS